MEQVELYENWLVAACAFTLIVSVILQYKILKAIQPKPGVFDGEYTIQVHSVKNHK